MLNVIGFISKLIGALRDWALYRLGVERTRRKQAEDTIDRVQKGQQGAQDAQDKLKQGKTPEEIVRENDEHWR